MKVISLGLCILCLSCLCYGRAESGWTECGSVGRIDSYLLLPNKAAGESGSGMPKILVYCSDSLSSSCFIVYGSITVYVGAEVKLYRSDRVQGYPMGKGIRASWIPGIYHYVQWLQGSNNNLMQKEKDRTRNE